MSDRNPDDAVAEVEAVFDQHGLTGVDAPGIGSVAISDYVWEKDVTTSVADPYTAVEVETAYDVERTTADSMWVVVRDDTTDAMIYDGEVDDVRAALADLVAEEWMEIDGHPGDIAGHQGGDGDAK